MTELKGHNRLQVDIWADVICPFCYLGGHRLAEAVATSDRADHIDLRVHTFQLDPSADHVIRDTAEAMAAKFGVPVAQAEAMESGLAQQAADQGQPYAIRRPLSSTFDMLRVVQLGNERGLGWDYFVGVQAEVFGGNPEAFAAETLVRVGSEVGLDADEVGEVLAGDRYAQAVRDDHETAVRLGAQGVPFTVLDGRVTVSGAVSVDDFRDAIAQAWPAQPSEPTPPPR